MRVSPISSRSPSPDPASGHFTATVSFTLPEDDAYYISSKQPYVDIVTGFPYNAYGYGKSGVAVEAIAHHVRRRWRGTSRRLMVSSTASSSSGCTGLVM